MSEPKMTVEELVRLLRNCANEEAPCKNCSLMNDPGCTDFLLDQAADMIERLWREADE